MEIKVNNLMQINALGHTCLGSSCRCIKHYKNLHRSMQGLLDQWISAQFCVRTIEFWLKLKLHVQVQAWPTYYSIHITTAHRELAHYVCSHVLCGQSVRLTWRTALAWQLIFQPGPRVTSCMCNGYACARWSNGNCIEYTRYIIPKLMHKWTTGLKN